MKIKATLETTDVMGDVQTALMGLEVSGSEGLVVNGEEFARFKTWAKDDDGNLEMVYSNGQRFRVTVRALGKAKASK